MNGQPDRIYLTSNLPGVGGRLKDRPEDFVVEEISAYTPCGDGEHLFLWVEKRDVSAEQLVIRLSRALRIRRGDIGVAGLKDRRAITLQYVSVPARVEPLLAAAEATLEGIRFLDVTRHRHKLKTGHLKGNRFEIVIRDVHNDAAARLTPLLDALESTGFPNYFGDQRFGYDGETLALGWQLLRGERSSKDLPPSRKKFLLRLALSAVQAKLFNDLLVQRIQYSLAEIVLQGDVLQKMDSGGCFLCEDVLTDQARRNAGEVMPTGPLFGPKMKTPAHRPAEMEQQVLRQADVEIASFSRFPKLTPGARRPLFLRKPVLHWEQRRYDDASSQKMSLKIEFVLPPGVYATTFLRELRKQDESP